MWTSSLAAGLCRNRALTAMALSRPGIFDVGARLQLSELASYLVYGFQQKKSYAGRA
jgi:hypothetical protein